MVSLRTGISILQTCMLWPSWPHDVHIMLFAISRYFFLYAYAVLLLVARTAVPFDAYLAQPHVQ